MGAFIPRHIRKYVYHRDGQACFWCDKPLSYRKATMDHIIPRSRRGGDDADNLVCSCEPCNSKRGDMPAPDFLHLTRDLRA